jgi:hypothetical protein
MLAYVFWHRPARRVEPAAYEERLTAFLGAVREGAVGAASFRLDQLPFAEGGGYEDWYLVEDWTVLGELNDAAIRPPLDSTHNPIAALTGAGWGGVYRLIDGEPEPPAGISWVEKPPGVAPESLAPPGATGLWQRQLVLGPAPELAFVVEDNEGRHRLNPTA